MTDLVWQDPPTPGGRRARAFIEEAAELRSHPKRWALLKTFPTVTAARGFKSVATRGRKASFRPASDWEFRADGVDLYARFIGEES